MNEARPGTRQKVKRSIIERSALYEQPLLLALLAIKTKRIRVKMLVRILDYFCVVQLVVPK